MLRIWLPLNKDLKNQGTSSLQFSTISNNTTFSSTDGLLGGCYKNNSNTDGGLVSDKKINLGQLQSMFCWIKLNSVCSTSTLQAVLGQHRYLKCTGMGITMRYLSATTAKLSVNTGNGSSRTYNTYIGDTILNSNTWYHIGYTYDNGTIKLYVNGNLDGTYTGILNSIVEDFIQIFGWSFGSASYTDNTVYGNYKVNGNINDVRIYDHCLSIKEIKDISKGLLLHYTFNNPYVENTNNLFKSVTSVQATRCEKYGNGFMVKTVSGDAYAGISLYGQLISGNTYQISFDVDMDESDSCLFGLYYSSRMNHVISIHKGRNVMTVTPTTTLSSLTFDDSGRSNSSPIYLTNFLIEEKDHATPYTPSSRTTTKILDNSGCNNTGTITGALTIDENSARGTYCTNLVNSYISTSLYPLPETTIAFWIKRNAKTGTRLFIYTGWYGISIEFTALNSWQVYYTYNSNGNTVSCSPTTVLDANTWYHCAFVIGTSGVKFYINGVCEKTSTYLPPYYNTSTVMIGNYSSFKNFNAKLSDFRVYSTALTEQDIKNLYNDSEVIDDCLNLYCYELNELEANNNFRKNGIVNTSNILEMQDYLYLPAGKYVNTQLYYDYNDLCKAETVLRYEAEGSGRDLMGFSGTASGYWGVRATGVWEPRGTFSYTDADITKINKITYTYAGSNDRGYYQIGALGGGYSPRNKFIYHTKLWKNGVFERDLYPAKVNNQNGLFDIVHNVFYPVTGSGSSISNESSIKIQSDNIITVNEITEI